MGNLWQEQCVLLGLEVVMHNSYDKLQVVSLHQRYLLSKPHESDLHFSCECEVREVHPNLPTKQDSSQDKSIKCWLPHSALQQTHPITDPSRLSQHHPCLLCLWDVVWHWNEVHSARTQIYHHLYRFNLNKHSAYHWGWSRINQNLVIGLHAMRPVHQTIQMAGRHQIGRRPSLLLRQSHQCHAARPLFNQNNWEVHSFKSVLRLKRLDTLGNNQEGCEVDQHQERQSSTNLYSLQRIAVNFSCCSTGRWLCDWQFQRRNL